MQVEHVEGAEHVLKAVPKAQAEALTAVLLSLPEGCPLPAWMSETGMADFYFDKEGPIRLLWAPDCAWSAVDITVSTDGGIWTLSARFRVEEWPLVAAEAFAPAGYVADQRSDRAKALDDLAAAVVRLHADDARELAIDGSFTTAIEAAKAKAGVK